MKKEIDPKVIGLIVGVVVLIAGVGLYFGVKGQGDRSGPLVPAKYEGGKHGPGGGGFVPGQPAGGGSPAPGATKKP